MSQSTAVVTRPAVRPAPRPSTRPTARAPRLRVVSAPAHARSRAGLVVASLVLLAVGLVGLLLLNVSLEKGAFVRRTQLAQIEQLTEQAQTLQEQIAAQEAPQALASRAASLGMVEAPNAAFLTTDGRILGVPSPGVANRPAIVTPRGPSADGQGAATGSVPDVTPSGKGSPAGAAVSAGNATTSTKVTAAGRAPATTTATSSGKPASSVAATKAPASTAGASASAAASGSPVTKRRAARRATTTVTP
ncbi:MAG TPA: hypothetical protein VI248_01085 [Kineosporiaceae bacterium]